MDLMWRKNKLKVNLKIWRVRNGNLVREREEEEKKPHALNQSPSNHTRHLGMERTPWRIIHHHKRQCLMVRQWLTRVLKGMKVVYMLAYAQQTLASFFLINILYLLKDYIALASMIIIIIKKTIWKRHKNPLKLVLQILPWRALRSFYWFRKYEMTSKAFVAFLFLFLLPVRVNM